VGSCYWRDKSVRKEAVIVGGVFCEIKKLRGKETIEEE